MRRMAVREVAESLTRFNFAVLKRILPFDRFCQLVALQRLLCSDSRPRRWFVEGRIPAINGRSNSSPRVISSCLVTTAVIDDSQDEVRLYI